jgi:hypothetical protein
MSTAGGTIYVLRDGGDLTPLGERPYDSEDYLQSLIATHPSLLAGEQMDPVAPRRWLLLSRELGVPEEEGGGNRWALDHLFVDQDAVPTFIEVKRASDTRIRREVVGQMLDYAANGTAYVSVDALRAAFEKRCRAAGVDPEQEIAAIAVDPATFWERMKTNLQAGRIRMVFVADEIPPSLRRIVEFLNEQMNPAEVLAVEIHQFVGDGLRTLVPRLVGQSVAAQQRKGSARASKEHWTRDAFLAQLADNVGQGAAEVARNLLAWAEKNGARVWWGARPEGSFAVYLERGDAKEKHFCFGLYVTGFLEIPFQYMASRAPFGAEERRDALRERLNLIPGVAIDRGAIGRRPSFSVRLLEAGAALAEFTAAFDWYLTEILVVSS